MNPLNRLVSYVPCTDANILRNSNCASCQDDLSTSRLVVAHTRARGGDTHLIHKKCIREIAQHAMPACPTCRAPFDPHSVLQKSLLENDWIANIPQTLGAIIATLMSNSLSGSLVNMAVSNVVTNLFMIKLSKVLNKSLSEDKEELIEQLGIAPVVATEAIPVITAGGLLSVSGIIGITGKIFSKIGIAGNIEGPWLGSPLKIVGKSIGILGLFVVQVLSSRIALNLLKR